MAIDGAVGVVVADGAGGVGVVGVVGVVVAVAFAVAIAVGGDDGDGDDPGLADGGRGADWWSQQKVSRFQSRQLRFSSRRPFSSDSAHLEKTGEHS